MESALAGPVTGKMVNVWYSADGSLLYARTPSGQIFQTEDFESWKPAVNAPDPPAAQVREPAQKPESGARYVSVAADSQDIWGLGSQLYRSEDGTSWQSLTSYRSASVIGPGINSVAVSPSDPNQLAVANRYGVWRSMDGGLTWSSLNLRLPNLSVTRILTTPSGGHSAKILDENHAGLELPPGSNLWQPYPTLQPQSDALRMQAYSAQLNATISAYGESPDGRRVYAGSDDGRIWVSADGGVSFQATATSATPDKPVRHLYVDPTNPQVAIAAMGGKSPHLFRTYNAGLFWDSLDSDSLPDTGVNSVTADPPSGAVYVATDKGVYWTEFKFETGVQTDNLKWTSVSENLPAAKAVDVALDPAGVQLYVALDGYGLYGTPAPHRDDVLRLVNAADYSSRAASPGSLVSILGAKVSSVSDGAERYPLWGNSQIQVPFEAVGPTVSLALETSSGTMTRELEVHPVSPAIFVASDGAPMILDADSGMPLEGNVAHPGQRLQILLNGLGKVNPDWPTGLEPPASNPPAVVAKVQAYLDGGEVSVSRATLAPGYVGYYLVEVQLPVVTNFGAMSLYISADGQESNHVQIVLSQ